MKFEKNIKSTTTIPTASMGDIVFMLLLFFMVTTIFKVEDGLPVDLPRAESGVEPKRELVSHIWIDRFDHIAINDVLVDVRSVEAIMKQKVQENPLLIVSFKTDTRTSYETVDEVMEALKRALSVRVSFSNKFSRS